MADWFFKTPAGVEDFQNPQNWHDEMAKEAQDIVAILVGTVLGKNPNYVTEDEIKIISPTLAYINPLLTPPPSNAETIGIAPWGGFPRAVERRGPWREFPFDENDVNGNYRAVEHLGDEDTYVGEFRDADGNPLNLPVRDRQDEYLEWAVRRNSDGKITKAIFVAEGYDYYSALFKHDEKRVVDLYEKYTETRLTADDLRATRGIYRHTRGKVITIAKPGEFNPRNRFNINPGIVHLSHQANSLGAEVNLAGVSGIARRNVKGNTLKTGNSELLLCCSHGGNPNRNSDPLIGEQAYAQVLEKRHYTLANPVGLYIAGVEDKRLTFENGDPVPRKWWYVERGQELWDSTKSRVLRLELEVPSTENIVLGDLYVDGNPLKYAGQLAELLSVHLFVTRWSRNDDGIGPVVGCDATCCKKAGTQRLIPTNEPCATGYQLAFKDLIPEQATPVADAFATEDDITTPIIETTKRRIP